MGLKARREAGKPGMWSIRQQDQRKSYRPEKPLRNKKQRKIQKEDQENVPILFGLMKGDGQLLEPCARPSELYCASPFMGCAPRGSS
jgi:hypothetical protein